MRLISSMVLFKMDSSTPFSRASSLRSCVAMHKDCRLAAVSTRGTAVPRLATTQPRQCQERRAGAHFCHLEKLTAACHCVPCAAFAGGDGAMLTMQRRARQQPLALHPAHGLVSGELCSDTRHIVDHRACAALCVHLRRLRSDPRANRAAMSLLSLGECKSFACGVVAREPSKSRRWLSRGEAASEAEACRGVVPPESTDVEETAFAQPAPGSRGGETSMPGAGAGREKGSGRERERARKKRVSARLCVRACCLLREYHCRRWEWFSSSPAPALFFSWYYTWRFRIGFRLGSWSRGPTASTRSHTRRGGLPRMVIVKPGPDGVEAGSLLPAGLVRRPVHSARHAKSARSPCRRGGRVLPPLLPLTMSCCARWQRLDEQLRLTYSQVTKNGCMDLKNVMFVSHTFRVSPFTAREAYNRFYPGAHNGLTRAQFVHVMRESMNRGGGGDGEGLTDRALSLHRSFAIPDAPLDASRRPTTGRPVQAKAKLTGSTGGGRPGKPGQAAVSQLADNIRSLESTLTRSLESTLVRGSQKGTPPAATTRFLDGSVTPRRISTASFIPSQRNLTLAAQRPSTSDGRAVNLRGIGGNVMGLYGRTPFSRDQSSQSGLALWAGRTRGGSVKNPFSPVVSTRPRTANEMGRTGRVRLGVSAAQGADSNGVFEDVESQSRVLLDKIAARLRQMNLQRGDMLAPFQHYDTAGSGRITIDHARFAFAELDVSISSPAVREIAAVAQALGPNDTVKYPALVGMLSSMQSGGQTLTRPPPAGDALAPSTLSISGVPIDLGDALDQLARATLQHRQEVYWAAGGKPAARKRLTFGEQVRGLDVNHNGTCTPAELKAVLTNFTLSNKQADAICDYLVADNNKTCPLGERGLIRYQLLLKMMHRETTMRGKVAGWDSCPVFPTEPVRSARKVNVKTMLDIQEPSERRRTGLASVYKKVNAHVASTAKLRRVFEGLDCSNSGLLPLDVFCKALERLDVYLAEDETVILMDQLDPHKSGNVDYSQFIALMLPPEIIKTQDHVFRKGNSGGPESLNASLHAMADLKTEEVLKIFRDGCHHAMSAGPERMKSEYSIFKVSGDAELTSADIKRFGQDFGLQLNERQCVALLSNIEAKNGGRIKFYRFMQAMLPQDALVSEGAPKG